MNDRKPGERPSHVKAPAHLSPNTPVPEPRAGEPLPEQANADRLEPTRYGDWEKKGIAIDF